MTTAAGNPGGGGGMAAGIGMGMGMAMAERMARRGPWGAAPGRRPARPPPPPGGAKRWHVAEDGQATGPFTRDELGRMAVGGHDRPATAGSGPRAGRTGSAAAT